MSSWSFTSTGRLHNQLHIIMLFTDWEVRTEKYFQRSRSEAAKDQRSRDTSETEGKYFSWPTLTVNNLFIFLHNA
jgi:hypothetical protein